MLSGALFSALLSDTAAVFVLCNFLASLMFAIKAGACQSEAPPYSAPLYGLALSSLILPQNKLECLVSGKFFSGLTLCKAGVT